MQISQLAQCHTLAYSDVRLVHAGILWKLQSDRLEHPSTHMAQVHVYLYRKAPPHPTPAEYCTDSAATLWTRHGQVALKYVCSQGTHVYTFHRTYPVSRKCWLSILWQYYVYDSYWMDQCYDSTHTSSGTRAPVDHAHKCALGEHDVCSYRMYTKQSKKHAAIN